MVWLSEPCELMVYHQTKFGYKMFGGLEDNIITQTNIN